MALPRILVLISGNGSNLQALIDRSADGIIPGQIVSVVSSSAKAYGLERAAEAKIPSRVHALKEYYTGVPKEDVSGRKAARAQFNRDLVSLIINEVKPDLIVCAGWMLILSEDFLEPLENASIPIINLHPSLPGAFEGINAIERSYEAGQNGTVAKGGCMIHKVIKEVDRGQPLVVREIDVVKGETLESWEQRIHALEHQAIVDGTVKALKELVRVD
ncbi:unnamed protein product [Kuraishia capsulata CBS 1993]|uniref:Phosphoribosylglycinamide formyltransferase n=1 Tax=Kuraishia capsulata CBS 1993 TaxID=1382522 RepID=W6MF45_9ASCO|nr:uncharacterized protein KUCA_T00000209001 [Kuraishia capsulata CBS 1993]CDK24249.1 unnamed protein product [Kuraishia capsulata CBS 1993]